MMGSGLVEATSFGLLTIILMRALTVIAASFQEVLDTKAVKKMSAAKGSRSKASGKDTKFILRRTQYVVITHNNQDTIVDTLKSIAACKPFLPVLLQDNASKDNTLSFAKEYVKNNPKKIKLTVTYNKKYKLNALLVKQLAKKARGTTLFVLAGNNTITPKNVRLIGVSLNKAPSLSLLSFNQKMTPSLHYFAILQGILRSYFRPRSPYTNLGFIAFTSALKAPQMPKSTSVYTSAYITRTPVGSVSEFIQDVKVNASSLPFYVKILCALDQTALLGIAIYATILAFTYVTAQLLYFVVTIVLLWLLYGIVASNTVNIQQKIKAVYFAPTFLVLMPFYSIVRVYFLLVRSN